MVIIAKNNSGSNVDIPDLGISIANGTQRSIYPEFSLSDLANNKDLIALINAGTIILNDGTSDLSIEDALDSIVIDSEYEDKKTEIRNIAYNGVIQPFRNTLNFTGTGLTFTDTSISSNLNIAGYDSVAAISAIQLRRTTSYASTTAWVDMTFDTVDVTTDTTTLERNSSNTARIDIKKTGWYELEYGFTIDTTTGASSTCGHYSRFYKNNTTQLDGSYLMIATYSLEIQEESRSITAYLTAGDYITFQTYMATKTGFATTIQPETIVYIKEMKGRGLKGDTGSTGLQGIPGIQGEIGPQGIQGPIGLQGETGSISAATSIHLTSQATETAFVGLDLYALSAANNLKYAYSATQKEVVITSQMIQVQHGTAQTGIGSTATAINFTTEVFKDSLFTHNNITNPSRIYVNGSGIYRVSYSVPNSMQGRMSMRSYIRVNASTAITYSECYQSVDTSGYSTTNSCTFIHQFTGGQYFEVMLVRSSGSNTTNTIANTAICLVELIRRIA